MSMVLPSSSCSSRTAWACSPSGRWTWLDGATMPWASRARFSAATSMAGGKVVGAEALPRTPASARKPPVASTGSTAAYPRAASRRDRAVEIVGRCRAERVQLDAEWCASWCSSSSGRSTMPGHAVASASAPVDELVDHLGGQQLFERDHDAALDAGVGAEPALFDAERLGGQRGRSLVDDLADAGQQVVVGVGEVAADDDDVGVEHVDRHGQHFAEAAAGGADRSDRVGVSRCGAFDDVVGCWRCRARRRAGRGRARVRTRRLRGSSRCRSRTRPVSGSRRARGRCRRRRRGRRGTPRRRR